eukprot:7769616-Pyramimonas_sp.AAC.1
MEGVSRGVVVGTDQIRVGVAALLEVGPTATVVVSNQCGKIGHQGEIRGNKNDKQVLSLWLSSSREGVSPELWGSGTHEGRQAVQHRIRKSPP